MFWKLYSIVLKPWSLYWRLESYICYAIIVLTFFFRTTFPHVLIFCAYPPPLFSKKRNYIKDVKILFGKIELHFAISIRIHTVFGDVNKALHALWTPMSLIEDFDRKFQAVSRLQLSGSDLGTHFVSFTNNSHRMAGHVLAIDGELELVMVHHRTIGIVLPADSSSRTLNGHTKYFRRYSKIESQSNGDHIHI